MQIANASAAVHNPYIRRTTAPEGQGTALAAGTAAKPDPVETFLAEAQKSPAERIREQWLERFNLTEESLAELTPVKREAVEKQIAEEIKRTLAGTIPQRGAGLDLTL